MYLDIPLFGTILSYTFEFLPVAREQMDVMESLLRDAQDEIAELKAELNQRQYPALEVIYLRSSTACEIDQYVQWDVPRTPPSDGYFELVSSDRRSIIVKQEGIYQISARLTNSDSSGSCTLQLHLNGQVVAQAYCGQETGYNNSVSLTEIIQLDPNSRLQIYHTGNEPSYAEPTFSHFSVVKLG
jgi:hypothetical protein